MIHMHTYTQNQSQQFETERQILQSDDPPLPPASSCVTSNMISFKTVTIRTVRVLFSSMVRYSRNLCNWANRAGARGNRWGCHSDQNECQWSQCGGCR